MLRKEVPDTFIADVAVKLILAKVPGFETLQPAPVIAPATAVIVPAVLFIIPPSKYTPQPALLNRFPFVTSVA